MYCSHCGKQIPDDSVFCHYCGAKVQVKAMPQQTETPRYDLNVPKPKFNWKHMSSWDDTSAGNIVAYKKKMGFEADKHNFICGMPTQKTMVMYCRQHGIGKDDVNKKYQIPDRFIISLEPDGMLLLGVKETVTEHHGYKSEENYQETNYTLDQKNIFIPKSKIKSARLFKQVMYQSLVVTTAQGVYSFIIEPAWNDKLYQIKNYRHFKKYVDVLN